MGIVHMRSLMVDGRSATTRSMNRRHRLLAGVAVAALSVGGVAQAETAIPDTADLYEITTDGDYSVADGVSVGRIYIHDTVTGILINFGSINPDISFWSGISNGGTISSLDNSAIIYGTDDAIANSGTITTLNNSGTISGTDSVNDGIVWNPGTITTLNNTGVISSGVIGVGNFGTITTLTNLGTISGTNYGIWNDGTITTLTNAQRGLTYTGTLPGTYNTYFSTAASPGTVVFTTSGTSLTYGLAKASGVSYAVGTYADVIASSSPLTFSYVTVDGVTYALAQDSSCSTSTYCYDLTISAVPTSKSSTWSSIGQQIGGNGIVIGQTLDQIAAQNGLSSQLSGLSALSGTDQQKAIAQLGATSLSASVAASGSTTTPSNAAIGNHLAGRLSRNSDGQGATTGVSTGNGYYKGALWGQVLGNHTSLDSSSAGSGFSSNAYGLLFGADLHASDNVVAGAAVNWLRNDSKGRDNASGNSTATDTYQLNFYGTWRPSGEALWLQGLTSVGYNHYDQKRDISFLGETASADYHGWQTQAKLTAGYDVAMNAGFTVSPMGSVRAARVWNKGYTETGSSVNQSVEGQSFNSVESVLGVKLSQQFDTGWGMLTADAQAGWLHDYVHSPIVTVANLSGVGYVLDTARLPTNGAQVALGGTLQQGDDLSLRLEYQGDLRPGYASHTGLLTVRQNF